MKRETIFAMTRTMSLAIDGRFYKSRKGVPLVILDNNYTVLSVCYMGKTGVWRVFYPFAGARIHRDLPYNDYHDQMKFDLYSDEEVITFAEEIGKCQTSKEAGELLRSLMEERNPAILGGILV